MKCTYRKLAATALLGLSSFAAQAASLVVFGDSLSDTGNNALALAAFGTTPQAAINNNSYIPNLPYSSGNYTNGDVWADHVARNLGSASALLPSSAGGTNFAFGGARTGTTPQEPPAFPFSLQYQVAGYLSATGGSTPADWYVVAGGGNDARDAVGAAALGGDFNRLAREYAARVRGMADLLTADGNSKVVVWNTPNLGATPAALDTGAAGVGLANLVTAAFNRELALAMAGSSAIIYDLYGSVGRLNSASGITDFTHACTPSAVTSVTAPARTSPACTDASTYLFWDGIHPTAAAHQAIADDFITRVVIPVPAAAWLMLFGLGAIGLVRRRSA